MDHLVNQEILLYQNEIMQVILNLLKNAEDNFNNKIMDTFLKKLRQKRDMGQEFLAKKIGVSRPTYAQIESGARDMSVKEAQKLAQVFGLSLEDFLDGKDISTPKVELEKTKKAQENKNQKYEFLCLRKK